MSESELEVYEGDEPAVPALTADGYIRMAERIEERVAAMRKIIRVVLGLTGPNDWIDHQGKPDITGSGAEKIARFIGISWDRPLVTVEREVDGHYTYIVEARFYMEGASVWAIGTRASSSPFFSKSHGKAVPVSEIDAGDVRKAAFTNCVKNGVSKLLGLRNMTWGDLEEAGFKRGDVQKVEYTPAEMDANTLEKRAEIGRMLFAMAGNDSEKAKDKLEEYTSFVADDGRQIPGRRELEGMKSKQIHKVHRLVEADYEKFRGEGNHD